MDSENQQILKSLERIELSAQEIVSEIDTKKADYSRELEERIKAFDKQLLDEAAKEYDVAKKEMNQKNQEQLLAMRMKALADLSKMDKAFEANQSRMANEIVMEVIRG